MEAIAVPSVVKRVTHMTDDLHSLSPESTHPIFSIGAVGRMLDLAPATLRTWEDRYGMVEPERSEGGRRLYSRAHVEQLRFVKARVDEGIQPADAHRLLAERLAARGGVAIVEPSGTGTRLLILLAERDSYAAALAEYFLYTEGYEVDVVFDADEAAHRFDERSPRLAIVELLLSDGKGLGLLRLLRERADVPLLAVSSLEARDQALEAGADAFLTKPLDPIELLSTVEGLLRERASSAREEEKT